MKRIYYRLDNFVTGEQLYVCCGSSDNFAHIVGKFCKKQGIDYKDAGLLIFQTRAEWAREISIRETEETIPRF